MELRILWCAAALASYAAVDAVSLVKTADGIDASVAVEVTKRGVPGQGSTPDQLGRSEENKLTARQAHLTTEQLKIVTKVADALMPWMDAHAENLSDAESYQPHGREARNITAPIYSNLEPNARYLMRVADRWALNVGVAALVAAVTVPTGLGYKMGGRWWVPGMLVASYAALIPGLFVTEQSYIVTMNTPIPKGLPASMMANMPPPRVTCTMDPDRNAGPVIQSTSQMVWQTWDAGMYLAATLCFIFAWAVPLFKLVLLATAECLRKSPQPSRVRLARNIIVYVQQVSKWASPDMFTMVLYYAMMRFQHHPPFLESLQTLHLGFTCYFLFCIGSVVSTCYIPLPEVKDEDEAKEASMPMAMKLVGGSRRGVANAASVLSLCWAVLFFVGLGYPVMQTKVDVGLMFNSMKKFGQDDQNQALDPAMIQTFLGFMHIDLEAMMAEKITLYKAMHYFVVWFFKDGELNLLLAFLILAVLCCICTIVSMLNLARNAYKLAAGTGGKTGFNLSTQEIERMCFFKHMSMIDVLLVGVLTYVAAMKVFKATGITSMAGIGFPILVAAEVCHYATFWVVHGTAVYLQKHEPVQPASVKK